MDQADRKTYYISIGAGEIFSTPNVSPWQFKIEATEQEIEKLRHIFNGNYNNSLVDFARAHVPFVEYHNDSTNDRHDENLIHVYQMIYELGDQEAKDHIDSIGILENFTSK
ncbi:hydrolase [Lederbergia sp. NSJ-179]|uniref:hydrolase n=1 Tax=Lederbergia sp. NSJ-179 TaxID=2931402 RepID=UPI001FD2A6D6|nr:hydrolase [Lederbergia sp. NSJ-179]MCJ7842681.1 hydrolase [Lederbergia sp. NSJ-179]